MNAQTFLPYGKQNITPDDIEEVVKVFDSNCLTRGPIVQEFENAIANYCGAKFAVAFNSGTAALIAACHVAKLNPNDRLITTPNTFVATMSGAHHYGATPVFVDIDPSTGNLDINQVIYSLSQSTRGKDVIIPVHFSGIPVDIEKLDRTIKDPNVIIIEDAAHALGSTYLDGQKIGCCANSAMTIFSFHPVKTITTGEGGMVTTNDVDLYHRLQRFRNNGIEREQKYLQGEAAPWYYEVQEITGNYNFTDFQAALGLSQLKRLDKMVEKRRTIVSHYRQNLQNISGIQLLDDRFDKNSAFHIFVTQIDFEQFKTTRTEVMNKLMDQGIGTQLHYIPVYRHPFFTKTSGDISEYFPKMENYFKKALSLPLFYEMTENDVNKVVETLKKVLRGSQ